MLQKRGRSPGRFTVIGLSQTNSRNLLSASRFSIICPIIELIGEFDHPPPTIPLSPTKVANARYALTSGSCTGMSGRYWPHLDLSGRYCPTSGSACSWGRLVRIDCAMRWFYGAGVVAQGKPRPHRRWTPQAHNARPRVYCILFPSNNHPPDGFLSNNHPPDSFLSNSPRGVLKFVPMVWYSFWGVPRGVFWG